MILQTKQVEKANDPTRSIVSALALLEAIRILKHAGHVGGGICLKCGSYHPAMGEKVGEWCPDCEDGDDGETVFPLEMARTVAIQVAVHGAKAVKLQDGSSEVAL